MALRLLVAILILAVPMELPGCGPFLPQALFFIPQRPEKPAEEFARGQLGILLPTYERFYQVIAYRYLTGVGLSDAERQEILRTGPVPQPPVPAPQPGENSNPWLAARNKVPGVQPITYLDQNRMVQDPGHFEIYENCHDDAFRTAAATLADRIRQFGAAAPGVADWIAAQDAVFSDCSQGAAIPQPASDPRLRADRAYQIASAKFYSRQYDAARSGFQSIAADESSPWRGIAPYLAARCLIRSGKLSDAAAELKRIAADPALARWHAAAASLLSYVETQLYPSRRMHDAALAIVKPNAQATIAQDLTDYRFLFDRDTTPEPADDLTDWIRSFQGGGKNAIEKWRVKHTLPWLVAALEGCNRGDTALPELLGAAREVKPDSPAYVTVAYHIVRLTPPDEARAEADELLQRTLPLSARNQIRGQRMQLARTFDEFLRFAPRCPVGELTEQADAIEAAKDYLDDDSALILNRQVPLALLRQASQSTLLPEHIRENIRRAVRVRSLLLSPAPGFDEVFALLKTPGLRPNVDTGYGRYTKEMDQIDDFRDNWWCALASTDTGSSNAAPGRGEPSSDALFLPASTRAQAAAEWAKLAAVSTGPNWLGSQTLAFAQAHPQDPRVPEALHLVVRATRYGCTDAQTGDVSHHAFDLLHRRYPNSEWTKQTPYWFK